MNEALKRNSSDQNMFRELTAGASQSLFVHELTFELQV